MLGFAAPGMTGGPPYGIAPPPGWFGIAGGPPYGMFGAMLGEEDAFAGGVVPPDGIGGGAPNGDAAPAAEPPKPPRLPPNVPPPGICGGPPYGNAGDAAAGPALGIAGGAPYGVGPNCDGGPEKLFAAGGGNPLGEFGRDGIPDGTAVGSGGASPRSSTIVPPFSAAGSRPVGSAAGRY